MHDSSTHVQENNSSFAIKHSLCKYSDILSFLLAALHYILAGTMISDPCHRNCVQTEIETGCGQTVNVVNFVSVFKTQNQLQGVMLGMAQKDAHICDLAQSKHGVFASKYI